MADQAEMIAELRRMGHRVTPQREMILDAICEGHGHISADEILRRVRQRFPDLNKPGVYRNLELLRDLGFITETDFGEGRTAYELQHHPRHHHLVCRQCRSMTTIDESLFADVEARLLREFGFAANLEHFAVWGLCRKCQAKSKRRAHAAKSNTTRALSTEI